VRFLLLFLMTLTMAALPARAQILNTSDFQIEWKVVNRFRLFGDEAQFRRHENAWMQYLIHVNDLQNSPEEKKRLVANSSVLGTEHVLNDRYIAFTRQLRSKFDWRGWAASAVSSLCWNPETRRHDACGGSAAYITPKAHEIELKLKPLKANKLISEYNCDWRIGDQGSITAPCDQPVRAQLPYPGGADIFVNAEGEQPISLRAEVKDLLIVGLGDSFASGEGNPDVPVTFSDSQRHRNLYPKRAENDEAGSAKWMDRLCHRSLYGHQLRAALQLALENTRASVTFLGYACSGAGIEQGILGPQEYVERVAGDQAGSRFLAGGKKDNQIYWMLRELCAVAPATEDGTWYCPGNKFLRSVDYLFLSVGGNDVGFSNVVAWATLREGTSATLAKFFGATVGPKQFNRNMGEVLPNSYTRLAKALEAAVPLHSGDPVFDPARVILSAYPDVLVDEKGEVCQAGDDEGADEDQYAANQALDGFNSWLATTTPRLNAVHEQLSSLHDRMKAHAGDLGWTFAARVHEERFFTRHGFCARSEKYADDPAETLMLPCWGKADRDTQTCQSSWSGTAARAWRPYDPATQNFPYALRQRWVRSFNDAYMAINQKVMTKSGAVNDRLSQQVFSETTGAMHPNAEGQAAMADAMLLDLRDDVAQVLSSE
jgi:hypothetical protein